MRLLVYIHSLENGGAERVVANLANYWVSIGWDVTVVTVAPTARDFYTLDGAVKREALNLAGGNPNVLAGFVRTVRRVQALRQVLQRVRPDIALSAMHTANVILAMAARGVPGVRAIGSEHNFPPKAPMGLIWETLRRHAYGHLTAVVALTQECACWLAAHSHATRIPVIPNAVRWPLSKHEPSISPAVCCAAGRQILLGVGRLSSEKNFSALVEIFSRLASKYPAWDLVILGDGPLSGALHLQVQAAGLQHRVFLPGRVGNVGDWYGRAALYVMSSHFEGFPNTLVEAMSYGLPAVSFDCDTGPRDIIRHDVDGLLVTPADAEGMLLALGKLMADAALREAFSRRALEARERFSMEKISSMWEGLFLSCSPA
ncbi:glycosyltransferase family 4 protein [Massilia sp. S19_KUP03_FR1]|uniref:glycosyltransferase family 4 protein n=1 Tax=Massilia sp. S19_KUP03_FR1 TaxID=3025503 RepID=UPI002FCD8DDE